jgi:hypothetical protein
MLNKRKAMIGYGVYTLAKPIAKAKLRKKTPEPPKRSKAKWIGGITAAVAAAGATAGGLIFWRKRRGSDESTG